MDSNGKKKLGVAIILAVFILYGLSIVAAVFFLEAPTGITVTYAVVILLFLLLLS